MKYNEFEKNIIKVSDFLLTLKEPSLELLRKFLEVFNFRNQNC